MDATRAYSNSPVVLAANGLGVALAGNDPDEVPFDPHLVNDQRRRFSRKGNRVDAIGLMQLHVRNAGGYAFLRSYQRDQLRLYQSSSTQLYDRSVQASFYRRNYRHYVPHDLLMEFLEHECPPPEDEYNLSQWQGNAIAGFDCGQDGHVVFYPTGNILQQACAWYSKGEKGTAPSNSSTVVETGSPIRQFVVLGNAEAYHSTSTSKIYAAARGATNCTVISAPTRLTRDNMHKMQAKAKISFSNNMINHIAASPHAEAELAFVTADGVVQSWDPGDGIQVASKALMNTSNRLLRCEYSSHPRVLWAVNRVTISTLDLRQPPRLPSILFDVENAGYYTTIYDVRRRSSNPFHFVVGTGVSVELVDSRMARQSLISWNQLKNYSEKSDTAIGVIDELRLSHNDTEDRGYIISSVTKSKVSTIFPFELSRARQCGNILMLASLRSDNEYPTTSRKSIGQFVAADATLDLHMEDGSERSKLTGVCALQDGEISSACIYQLNSLGDLYSHRVNFSQSRTKSYRAGVQLHLPCGITAQNDGSDESRSRTLPIPIDALLQEIDTESAQMFTTLPVKILQRQFPRLVEDNILADSINNVETKTNPVKEKNKPKALVFDKRPISSRKDESVLSLSAHLDGSHFVAADAGTFTTTATSKKRSRVFDTDELINKVIRACDPSISLYRLHRYIIDELKVMLSSSEMMELLLSNCAFRVRVLNYAPPPGSLRVHKPSISSFDNVHHRKDDSRLATCTCTLRSPYLQLPCQSWSCIIPHAVIVSSVSTELHMDDTAQTSSPTQALSNDLAVSIAAARAAYEQL